MRENLIELCAINDIKNGFEKTKVKFMNSKSLGKENFLKKKKIKPEKRN